MGERDALLWAILSNPDDDIPRLVFADWLDEHDQPGHAEFIRLQIEAERIRGGGCAAVLRAGCDGKKEWCVRCGLLKRAHALHNTAMPRMYPAVTRGRHAWEMYDAPLKGYDGGTRFKWRRGFVDGVATTIAEFFRSAVELFGRHPVRDVILTDVRPYRNESGRFCWAREPIEDRGSRNRHTRHFIGEMFWLLPDRPPSTGRVWSYAFEQDAMTNLSRAAVAWARRNVGLATASALAP